MSPAQIAAAVVAVGLVATAGWRWSRMSLERRLGFLAAAAALAIYASGLLSELPDLKVVIGDVAKALGSWTYALVGVMAFLETGAFVGLVAPGETVVIAGGFIAGQGEIQLAPLIGIVWTSAVLGDTTSFFIGRRLGRSFLERHGPRVKITHERLEQVDGYFERHGGKTILIGRFIGLVRALAPFIAGSSGMAYRRFIPFSVVGTGLWTGVFCSLGYIFWRSFDQVAHVAGQAVFGFGLTVAIVFGIVTAYRRREEIAAWFAAHERHPVVRPLLAVARPVYRRVLRPLADVLGPELGFLWNRVTPGELGLELTTAVAVGAVGAYVCGLYTVILAGDTGLTPLDRELFDLAGNLRQDTVVSVVKFVTELGSLVVVSALLVVTVVVLLSRRRPVEAGLLLLGSLLIFLSVDVIKAAIDRPRPAGPLVSTSDSAFPSGHAAYSTIWVAMAVVLTRGRGLAGTATVLTGAVVVAAAIGVSRIYLRAHYWSDVAGGWALGAGIFGLLATTALIVDHVRNNHREPASRATAGAER